MPCPPATNVVLTHVTGPKALIATWDADDPHICRFEVQLIQKYPLIGYERVIKKRSIFPSARKYTFKNLSLGTGQTWYVAVYVICEDCTRSIAAVSDDLVLNGV